MLLSFSCQSLDLTLPQGCHTVAQGLQIIGAIQGQGNCHSFALCDGATRGHIPTERQIRHLPHISFELIELFKVLAHLLELRSGHERGQSEVSADLFDDRLFR